MLYAPTWEGHYADKNYGSLPVGPEIIRELLARERTIVSVHTHSATEIPKHASAFVRSTRCSARTAT